MRFTVPSPNIARFFLASPGFLNKSDMFQSAETAQALLVPCFFFVRIKKLPHHTLLWRCFFFMYFCCRPHCGFVFVFSFSPAADRARPTKRHWHAVLSFLLSTHLPLGSFLFYHLFLKNVRAAGAQSAQKSHRTKSTMGLSTCLGALCAHIVMGLACLPESDHTL